MLDKTAIVNHYTYMMHINYMTYTRDEIAVRFLETMKHFKFYKWIATEELGAEKKLLHLQCCLWHSESSLPTTKIKDYKFSKQRRYKSGKDAKKKATQISFASGTKDTLATYSAKEFFKNKGTPIITNLTKTEMKLIPKWVDLKDEKIIFNKMIHAYCPTIASLHPWIFRNKIIDKYSQAQKIPTVHTLRKLTLLYNNDYNASDLQEEIGSLRNTRFSQPTDYQQCYAFDPEAAIPDPVDSAQAKTIHPAYI